MTLPSASIKKYIFSIIILLLMQISIAKPNIVQQQSDLLKTAVPSIATNTLSLNFQDISARDLLALLAETKGINLIMSDAVSGHLTVRLENVTWRQALDTILTMQGLGSRERDNVLFIAPAEEIAAGESRYAQVQDVTAQLIPIRYAKAADLNTLLQNKANGLLSERGNVAVDERTNQLWVQDTPQHLAEVRRFLHGIDVPAKQLKIAARIVNVDESSVEELGLKFGTVATDSGNANTLDQLHMDMPLTIEDVGHFTVAIAKLGQGTLLDLELSALERQGRARIISNPQLITANRQPAVIESGQEIPYQESTSSGATNITFKKAVLSLKVTPEVTPENRILLNIAVNQDKVDALTVNGMPAVSTQQVQSQVLLNNGETIVLGGVYEQSDSHRIERIPFWGNIPILGKLFTSKQTRSERKELLIFVTPEIMAS